MTAATPQGIPTQLGHIALRVQDVDRSVAFYTNALGLTLRERVHGIAFLGARADASHELALFPLPAGAEGSDAKRAGMYHMAWEMASFAQLEQLHQRLLAQGVRIAGYSDGQCNVMFLDPDGNELEAIWEPSPEEQAKAREPGGAPLPRLPH